MLSINLPNFITVSVIVLLMMFIMRFALKAVGKESPV